MAFVTSYGGLIELAKLQAGEYVILGAASSSVGLAAIQIAKMQGAKVIALSRTHAKGDILLTKGADFVLATKEDNITACLHEITGGQGVGVVFDPVGGEDAYAIFRAMALNGRYFIYGALSHEDIAVLVFDILGKHFTLRGYELFEITTDFETLKLAKTYIYEGLASGKLRPEIDRTFAFTKIRQAYDYMENGAQIGEGCLHLNKSGGVKQNGACLKGIGYCYA
ncbi:zinc-binding dehydrogenase [Helicobacter suis]|uniref:zinc-binding dehydrogenase n=1 Tax=Helicobacter suis TaxID=104628 RepID=UPI001F073A32|nr:zinc-binding dehydrogenase [Helicobacter suis]